MGNADGGEKKATRYGNELFTNFLRCARLVRWRAEEVRSKVGVRNKISEKVNQYFLNWYRYMECLSGDKWTKRVYESDMEGRMDSDPVRIAKKQCLC